MGRPAGTLPGLSRRIVGAGLPRLGLTRDFALGLTFVLLAFVGLARAFAPHTPDEAWVALRCSRQWAAGQGPYFNPGEHVERCGELLWMLVMAPVIRFAGPAAALPAAKGIGLAASLLTILGAALLGRRAAAGTGWREVAGLASAGLVACSIGFAWQAMSGLETALDACLLTWGVAGLVAAGERSVVLGGVSLALAALARPEAPIPCLLACAAAMLLRTWGAHAADGAPDAPEPARPAWQPAAIATLTVAVAVLAQTVFRVVAFGGTWLPATARGAGALTDRLAYVRDALRAPFLGDVGLAFALLGWLFGGPPSRASALVGLTALAGAALPLAMGVDVMPAGRLLVPYLPLLAVTIACGWGRLLARARRGSTGLLSAALILSAPLSLGLGWGAREELVRNADVQHQGERTGRGALAAWLAARARPGDTILLEDTGLVGYRCIEQRVVDLRDLLDLSPLADHAMSRSPDRVDLASALWPRAPEFIVLSFTGGEPHERPAPASALDARLAADSTFRARYLRAHDPPASTPAASATSEAAPAAAFGDAVRGGRVLLAVFPRLE